MGAWPWEAGLSVELHMLKNLTGIATAMLDSSPIVCITGQVGSKSGMPQDRVAFR